MKFTSINQEVIQDVLDFYVDKAIISDDRYARIINRENAKHGDSSYPPLTLSDLPSDLGMFLARFENYTDSKCIVIMRSKPGSVDLSARTEDIIVTILLSYSHDDIERIPSDIWEKYNVQHTGKSKLIRTLAGDSILNINFEHRLRSDMIYKFRTALRNCVTNKCFELDGYISTMKKADMIAKITSMRDGEPSIPDEFNKFYGFSYCDEVFINKYDERFEKWNSPSKNSILNGIRPSSTILVSKEVEEENLSLDDDDEIDLISIEIRDPVTNVLI